MLNKIGVIGGGNIGGVLVQEIVRRRLSRSVGLMDILEPEFAGGKCLDIAEGTPIIGVDIQCEGARDYNVIKGADIVINTAGVPRKPKPDGSLPSREELLTTNLKITDQVAAGIQEYAPKAIVISIANPLDAIVYTLNKRMSPPKSKLFGMAGVLDSARYRYFVAQAAGVSVDNVEALVLGGHGDTMVPVRSCCRIGGMPVEKFVDEETLAKLEDRTRKAGGEVVKMLGVGSAFVSPAWAAIEMADAIAYDRKKIMPVCAKLEGEYGVNGLFVGVPGILGRDGLEKVIEADLTDDEKKALAHSVEAVSKTCNEVEELTK
jgi:malate dehydrogenase